MISSLDYERLNRTLLIAATSQHKYKVGAMIVRGGSILSFGINKYRNNPRYIDWTLCSVHAEEACLARLGSAKNATIYIVRMAANTQPTLAKPCQRCLEALVGAGIERIVWTTYDGAEAQRI